MELQANFAEDSLNRTIFMLFQTGNTRPRVDWTSLTPFCRRTDAQRGRPQSGVLNGFPFDHRPVLPNASAIRHDSDWALALFRVYLQSDRAAGPAANGLVGS